MEEILQVYFRSDIFNTFYEIGLRSMPQKQIDDKSTLVQGCLVAPIQAITWANTDPDLYRHMAQRPL